MKTIRSVIYMLMIALLFWQCSSDEIDDANLSGTAVKGVIVNADVTVYAYDGSGTRGELLATTTSDQNGNFSVNIDFRGVVEVVVTGGNYEDEASGQQVSVGSFEFRNIVNVDGNESFGVTALTTIAAEHIDEHAQDGLQTAIDNANREVAAAFGIPDVDISGDIPVDLSSPVAVGVDPNQLQYGAVQAGLSELISTNELSPEELLVLIKEMAADFRDGTFDGMSGDAALNFALSLTPPAAIDGLQTAINSFLNGPNNGSGLSPVDIFG